MKFIIVGLLVIFVEQSLCVPGRSLPTTEPSRKLPYLLPGLNPLDVHSLNSCGKDETNAKPIRAWMGPCWNSGYCQIPHCCGIISGQNSTFVIEYEATTPFKSGIFNGNFDGVGLGDEADGKDCTDIHLGFQLTVPGALAGYSHDLCSQTTCPQYCGKTYNLTVPFRFVTVAMTSLGIKANFVAEVLTEKKEQALCWGLYAALENVNLANATAAVVKDVVTLDVLDNPFNTLALIFPGIIPDYNRPINLKKNLLGANFGKQPKKC